MHLSSITSALLGQIVLPFPGIPKPQPVTERAFNQQPASGAVGPPGAAAASKLPVKGLTTSLSFSAPENNEKSRAMTRGELRNPGHVCSNRVEDLDLKLWGASGVGGHA